MRAFICLAAFAVAGCAMSAAGLGRSPVELVIESQTKTPQQFAECSVETMIGNTAIRGSGDHYYVLRYSGYQIPYARWDFRPRPGGGSVAELRRANISVGAGVDRVRNCA